MKRIIASALGLGLLAFAGVASASANGWFLSMRSADDTYNYTYDLVPPDGSSPTQFMVWSDLSHLPAWYDAEGARNNMHAVGFSELSAATSSINSTVSSLSSSVSSLSASMALMTAFRTEAIGNLFGTSTSMTFANASTTNGLMTATQQTKLDSLTAATAWTWTTPSRSIVTGTGAVGFQPSSSQVSTVRYNVNISTTATIGGASGGYIALEVAPTNSATAGDWVEMGRCNNSQTITLAIALQVVQGVGCQLNADIPVGYYAKLRSVTTAGTPTFSFVSASEVLK